MRLPLLIIFTGYFCLSGAAPEEYVPSTRNIDNVERLRAAGFQYIVADRKDAPFDPFPASAPTAADSETEAKAVEATGSAVASCDKASEATREEFVKFVSCYTHGKIAGCNTLRNPSDNINMQYFSAIYTLPGSERPGGHTHFPAEMQRYFQEHLNQEAIAQHFVLWYLLDCTLLDSSDMHLQVDEHGKINIMLTLHHDGYFGFKKVRTTTDGEVVDLQKRPARPHILHGLPSEPVPSMRGFLAKPELVSKLQELVVYSATLEKTVLLNEDTIRARLDFLKGLDWEEEAPRQIFVDLLNAKLDEVWGGSSVAIREEIEKLTEHSKEDYDDPSIFTCPADEHIMQVLAGKVDGKAGDALIPALRSSLRLVFSEHKPKDGYGPDAGYKNLIRYLEKKADGADEQLKRAIITKKNALKKLKRELETQILELDAKKLALQRERAALP